MFKELNEAVLGVKFVVFRKFNHKNVNWFNNYKNSVFSKLSICVFPSTTSGNCTFKTMHALLIYRCVCNGQQKPHVFMLDMNFRHDLSGGDSNYKNKSIKGWILLNDTDVLVVKDIGLSSIYYWNENEAAVVYLESTVLPPGECKLEVSHCSKTIPRVFLERHGPCPM